MSLVTKIRPLLRISAHGKLELLDRVRQRVHLIRKKEIPELDSVIATDKNPTHTGNEPSTGREMSDRQRTKQDPKRDRDQDQGPVRSRHMRG